MSESTWRLKVGMDHASNSDVVVGGMAGLSVAEVAAFALELALGATLSSPVGLLLLGGGTALGALAGYSEPVR